MTKIETCALCKEQESLTTLGQYRICPSCYLFLVEEVIRFAKRNTVRGTVYHAAFEAVENRLTKEPEKFIKEARDGSEFIAA